MKISLDNPPRGGYITGMANKDDMYKCLVFNGLELNKNNIISIPVVDRLPIAQFVFDTFRKNGFPYWEAAKSELFDDFANLKSSVAGLDDKIIVNNGDAGTLLFKCFCPHFFSVSSKNSTSIKEAFDDDKKLMATIQNRLGMLPKRQEVHNITKAMLLQGFRNSGNAFAASSFKATTAKFIYDRYCKPGSVVLDCSAGFGQRMLGATACPNVSKYIGYDPWKETIDAIQNMVNCIKENNRVELHNVGSEYIDLPTGSVDFAFSSPPYYNKEIYSQDVTQAYNNRSKSQFFDEWWEPTINNIERVLKPGGVFVLNMDSKLFNVMKMYSNMTHVDTLYISKAALHRNRASQKDEFYILTK